MATFQALNASTKQKFDLNTLKAFSPAILGTVVEYYDYTLYGFCASLLAEQFFPTDDPTIALLKTFGVFLMGSLSKPLGAFIFGYIGDRFGRSISLKISMIGIALPTTFLGLMPTYQEIGWIAPFLLLICRILQGIFTAGESDGVRIFIFESFFKTRPCFANSLSGVACMVGIYLASTASSWVIASGNVGFLWRIPFILGGILGIFVFLGRRALNETAEFISYQKSKDIISSDSFLTVLIKNKLIILATILLCGSSGGRYHFYLVFLSNYLSSTLNILDPKIAAINTSQAILVYTLFAPIAGLLADYLGLIRILKIAFGGLVVVITLNIMMISKSCMPTWLILATAGTMVFLNAPVFALLMQKIRVGERYRVLSFGHSVGSMIFSGSTPLLSLWLWHVTQVKVAPFLYFALLTLMGFLGIFLLNNPFPMRERV